MLSTHLRHRETTASGVRSSSFARKDHSVPHSAATRTPCTVKRNTHGKRQVTPNAPDTGPRWRQRTKMEVLGSYARLDSWCSASSAAPRLPATEGLS